MEHFCLSNGYIKCQLPIGSAFWLEAGEPNNKWLPQCEMQMYLTYSTCSLISPPSTTHNICVSEALRPFRFDSDISISNFNSNPNSNCVRTLSPAVGVCVFRICVSAPIAHSLALTESNGICRPARSSIILSVRRQPIGWQFHHLARWAIGIRNKKALITTPQSNSEGRSSSR